MKRSRHLAPSVPELSAFAGFRFPGEVILLRPMLGFKRGRAASIVIRGHAFIQNIRRGHYELGANARNDLRIAAASTDSPKQSDQIWRHERRPRPAMN
jgi:hypothetical protein